MLCEASCGRADTTMLIKGNSTRQLGSLGAEMGGLFGDWLGVGGGRRSHHAHCTCCINPSNIMTSHMRSV